MRICSKPLFITNTLKLAINGIFPTMARPAPTPTMFASAMPQEMNRSGNSLAKYVVMVDFERSASTTTTSLFSRPSSTTMRPKASRVDGPILISNLGFAVLIWAGMVS
jgi:hypothetical protein